MCSEFCSALPARARASMAFGKRVALVRLLQPGLCLVLSRHVTPTQEDQVVLSLRQSRMLANKVAGCTNQRVNLHATTQLSLVTVCVCLRPYLSCRCPHAPFYITKRFCTRRSGCRLWIELLPHFRANSQEIATVVCFLQEIASPDCFCFRLD